VPPRAPHCCVLCFIFSAHEVLALLITTSALLVQLFLVQDVLVNVYPWSVVVNFDGICVWFLSFLHMNV